MSNYLEDFVVINIGRDFIESSSVIKLRRKFKEVVRGKSKSFIADLVKYDLIEKNLRLTSRGVREIRSLARGSDA